MFRGWFSIRNQLLLLAALATGSIWAGALLQYWQLQSQSQRLDGVQQDLEAAQLLAESARQVGRERGLTNGWLRAQPPRPVDDLTSTRSELDTALARTAPLTETSAQTAVRSRLSDLKRYRQMIDRRDMPAGDVFDWYSDLIEALFNQADGRLAAGMIEVGLAYEHVNHLMRATEHLARLRGLTNGALAAGAMEASTRNALARAVVLHHEYMMLFERTAPREALARSVTALNEPALRNSLDTVRRLLASGSVAELGITPQTWWSEATVAVDTLQRVGVEESAQVTHAAQLRIDSLRRQMWLTVAALLVLGVLTLALVLSTVGRIVRGISVLMLALENVATRRNLKTRIDDSRSDEFGQISRGVNKLVAMASGVVDEHERVSLTDALTGALNRRGLDQQLAARLNPERKHHAPLCLLLLDIDRFKSINDTLGHPAGDAVLAGLAQVLVREVRPDDVVARFGGEEFVLLLPGCELDEAAAVADKVRRAIEAQDFGIGRTVTISLGAALHAEKEVADTLLARADAALYRAKNEGRNRVCVAPQP